MAISLFSGWKRRNAKGRPTSSPSPSATASTGSARATYVPPNTGFKAVTRTPPWRKPQVKPFNRPVDIPQDIGRYIMETAAWDDRKLAHTLLFVSRMVHSWIKPILIHSFQVTDYRFLQLLSASYSSYDLAQYVKALNVTVTDYEHTFMFLETCQNIEHLSFTPAGRSNLHAVLAPSIAHLRPQSLILEVGSIFPTADFTLPFFSNLTHLYVTDLPNIWPKWRTFHHLPRLTHLAFDRYSYQPTTFASLKYILQRCNKLEYLLIVVRTEFRGTAGFDPELVKDMRFVFVRVNKIDDEWQDFVDGGRDNLWIYAERVTAIRRKSLEVWGTQKPCKA